jgi:aspartate/glutamate racemase
MVSVDFQRIEELQHQGDWAAAGDILARKAHQHEELCLGNVREDSRKEYLRIIDQLHAEGAQGVIEGCTEIVMLIQQQHTRVPLFDTTAIHAREAVAEALK